MSVNIRKRKNKDGTISIVLDIYYEGKRRVEFLKELKLVKVKSPLDREENREREKMAKEIAFKRGQELQGNEYGIIPDFKKV